VVTEAQFNCPVYCTKDVKWVPIVTGSPHSGGGTLNPCGDRGTIQLPGVLYKRLLVKWLPIVTGSPHSGGGTLNPCGDRGTIQLPAQCTLQKTQG